jgi:RNA recognition motif-containing protein
VTKIYIGGVSFAMSNDGLRALFAEIGVVESAVLVTDGSTGYSRGFGFVEMASAEAAAAAVKKFHRLEVDGRRLAVHLAGPTTGR